MQKLVRGATKPKATAPKAKYIEPILSSTYEAGHDFEVVMDNLAKVIHSRSGPWPSIYKALIVIHIMVREGAMDVALQYLADHPRMLDVEDYLHRAPAMGRYSRYLSVRAQQFKETNVDFVRYRTKQGFSRLHKLTISKGLLRESSSVLIQLEALMKCQYQEQDIVNDDVLLMAFRLLVHDALSLFQVLNEGVINILEHFFELSKVDAEEALELYRGFRRVTSKVIAYLRTAKDFEFKTMLHVPNIKHAPTSLVSSLEMYLNDPEFEANRQKYLSEKDEHNLKRSRSKLSRGNSVHSPLQTQNEAQQHVQQQIQFQQQQPSLQAIQPQPALQAMQPQAIQPQTAQAPIQPQSPGSATNPADINPFWQTQQEASNIQATDGQAQLQMQQLKQLQMQQIEQQERIKQQIQQLEQQRLQQQQMNQQQLQQQMNQQIDFDFGFQPAQQPVQQPTIQPVGQIQPIQSQPPTQPQSPEYNPFKRATSVHYQQPPLQSTPTGPLNSAPTGPLTGVPTGPNQVFQPLQPQTTAPMAQNMLQTQQPMAQYPTGMQPMQTQPTPGHNPFAQSQLVDLGQKETNPFRL